MRPSDEVKCIKDMNPSWHRRNTRYWHCTPPVVGQRYTVRAICPVSRDIPRILLTELRNGPVKFSPGRFAEASFPVKNFRLITRTVTDVKAWLDAPTDPASEQWDNRKRINANG
jgi:hypothetical protein